MKPVIVSEYERIYYADDISIPLRRDDGWRVPRCLLERLRRFDESHARENCNYRAFDWQARNFAKATSYVGVIQIPGLIVEILPKIDRGGTNGDREGLAQRNLLYMLTLTRNVPLVERDLAGLKTESSLLETLIGIFVRRLLDEMRKGLDHAYIHHEENRPVLKGKLLFPQQVRHNAAHQERVFVSFDEFVADTSLNRIFKATCRRLLGMVTVNSVQKGVREALAVLDEVRDCQITHHDFDRIHLSRSNERFAVLLSFCRMILCGQGPAPVVGREQTFSLLFPMEQLFEEFIGAVISRNSVALGLGRGEVHLQDRRRDSALLRNMATGNPMFRLRPDIVIGEQNIMPRLIVDTKWKCLTTSEQNRNNNVSQADVYQLYAYATHYGCRDNVLLYPAVAGVDRVAYALMADHEKRIRIEQVDVSEDLRRNKARLLNALREILVPHTSVSELPGPSHSIATR